MRHARWVVAIVLAFHWAWAEEEQPEIKYNLELRERYHSIDKGAGGDEPGSGYDGTQGYVAQRSLLGMNFRKGEKLGGQLTLIHNARWGKTNTQTSSTDTTYGPNSGDSAQGVPDGVGNGDNMILVNEALGWWKMSDSTTLKLGRTAMHFGDGSVVARNDWEGMPTSFDAAVVSWDMDKLVLNFFGTTLERLPRRSTTSTDANDPAVNLYGVSADGKMLPELLTMLHGHLLQINGSQNTKPNLPTAGGAPANDVINSMGKNIQRLGFTVAGQWRRVDFRTSGAFVTGILYQKPSQEVAVQSYMTDLELGYTFPQFIRLRFYGNFHLDSGDWDVSDRGSNQSSAGADNRWTRYDSLFYDAHRFSGLMDIIGWGNLTYYQVGITATPFESATAGVHYLIFKRTSEKDVVTPGKMGTELLTGFTPDAGKRDDPNIGAELDVTGDYNFENGFTAGFVLGLFFPGNYIKDGNNAITGTSSTNTLGENIRVVTAQAKYQF